MKIAQLSKDGEDFYPVIGSEGLANVIPVTKGGTGANNADDARANLGISDSIIKFADASQGITSGTVNATDDKTITATDDCVVYFLWQGQANSNLTLQLWLNDVKFIDYASGGAVNLTASIIPFYLKKDDTLRIVQSNNKSCGYSIFKLE